MKTKKGSQSNYGVKASIFVLLLLAMAGLIAYGSGVIESGSKSGDGLSGLVSVKGTVNLEALKLSKSEVAMINRAVDKHQDMFNQVDLYIDSKGGSDIDDKTVLVMALVLDANGECEVRSWSRKVVRHDLVSQLVRYMGKAANEYEQFKKYPDVKQNFKCLYI